MNFLDFIQELSAAKTLRAGLSLVLAFFFAQLMPILPLLAGVAILVICDWVTGVTASISTGEKFTSRRLFRMVQKIVFYTMALVLLHMVSALWIGGAQYPVIAMSFYIALTELYSNYENIERIVGQPLLRALKALKIRKP